MPLIMTLHDIMGPTTTVCKEENKITKTYKNSIREQNFLYIMNAIL
jgi:hypothetical protein